jgi:hypothetical protein
MFLYGRPVTVNNPHNAGICHEPVQNSLGEKALALKDKLKENKLHEKKHRLKQPSTPAFKHTNTNGAYRLRCIWLLQSRPYQWHSRPIRLRCNWNGKVVRKAKEVVHTGKDSGWWERCRYAREIWGAVDTYVTACCGLVYCGPGCRSERNCNKY